MTLLLDQVRDQVRIQGRNKIDDSMQSLLRPCCLSYFSSLFLCVCVLLWHGCYKLFCYAATCVLKLVCVLVISFSSPFSRLSRMAWTGSEPELVGTDAEVDSTSTDWEWVPDKKEVKVEVDEEVSKLADDLNQVIKI